MQKNAFPAEALRKGTDMYERPAGGGSSCITKMLLVMRITILLLTVGMLQVSARGISQAITYSGKEVPLEKIMREFEKQTGYGLLYTEGLLENSVPVTIRAVNMPFRVFLDKIFENQPLKYIIKSRSVVLVQKTPDPTSKTPGEMIMPDLSPQPVTGRIVDTLGNPVQGASVHLLPGNKGSFTDSRGEFVLKEVMPGNYTIEISFVGYKTIKKSIGVGGESALILGELMLSPLAAALSDVQIVNTGFQELPKERATGSFSFVDNKTFNEQVTTNILDRLPAIANSINLDARTSKPGLSVRGISTINGPSGPLIVVDNFPYAGDLSNINPNDVENITVLKDAAAASIWGTKAGNGVIVITTKKGKFNRKLHVDAMANITIAEKPDLYSIPLMSVSDYIDVEKLLFSQKYRFSDTLSNAPAAFSPVYEILFSQLRGKISAEEAEAQINTLRTYDVRKDYEKYMYQGAVNQQYAINLNGGNDKVSWVSSLGLDKNADALSASYQRITGRLENTYKPLKNLNITTGILYTQVNTGSGATAYSPSNTTIPPYMRLVDENGVPQATYSIWKSYTDTLGQGLLMDWGNYPSEDYKHTRSKVDGQSLLAKIGVNYKILPGISMDVLYQYQRQQNNTAALSDQDSYNARYWINRFSQVNYTNHSVVYKVPPGGIYDLSSNIVTANNFRAQLNVDRSWGNHALNAIIGAEAREQITRNNSYRTYGYTDDILKSQPVDYTQAYPVITGGTDFIPGNSGFSERNNRYVSTFANGSYTYANRYTVSLSGRRDGSNLFGATTNDKWTPLWSAGMAWNISNEDFYKNSVVPYLKFRFTYGFSGNADLNKTGVTILQYSITNPYTLTPTVQVLSFGDPELRWEKVRTINIGADFRIIRDIVSGSVEYYRKKATDLFGTALVDYTGGAGNSIMKNVANMSGSGWDFNLHTLNMNRAFRWETDWNISVNHDKVTRYMLNTRLASNFVLRNIPAGIEGKPVFSVFSYKWAGLNPETGAPQGYLDGQVSQNYSAISLADISTAVYNGPALPVVFGNIGNTFSYRNFSLNIRLMYKLGHYFRRPSIQYNQLRYGNFGHADFAQRWQKPGDELHTNVPALVFNNNSDSFYQGSEMLAEKADHLRLQYINLNYNFSRFLHKETSLQVFAAANNLGILWRANKQHLDPDALDGAYTVPKSFVLGIKAGF